MSVQPFRHATYADVLAAPPHVVAELIGGRLETQPRPSPRHAGLSFALAEALGPPFRRGRGGPGGWVFLIEPELHLGSDVVVPDFAGWRRERLSVEPSTPYLEIPPDWVCEILSPSTQRLDRGPKRQLYGQAGVKHLWLIDPDARQLEVFTLAAPHWLLVGTLQTGERVRAVPFDAIDFAFDDLFPFDSPQPPPTEA